MADRIDAAWNTDRPTFAARRFYALGRNLCVAFSRLWFRVRVEGREHVPADGPFILAPVHRSNVDALVVAAVTRRPLRFLGKDSLWRYRPLGWVFSALGGVPVHRDTAADRDALRRCEVILRAGQPLVLFPEGTRRSGPIVSEVKDGPAFLALRTGAPIVPVGIGGSEAAQPRGRRAIRPVKVCVVVGEPLRPETRGEGRATSRRAVRELTERLQGSLQALFDEAQAKLS